MSLARSIVVFGVIAVSVIAASLLFIARAVSAEDGTLDASAYARTFSVPVSEAARRLHTQPSAGRLQQALIQQEPTFGGLWIDNGATYRVIVGFTRDGDRTLAPYSAAFGLSGVATARQVRYTLGELQRDVDLVAPLARATGADLSLNVKENRIDLLVISAQAASTAAREIGLAIPSTVLMTVVPAVTKPLVDVYGGLPLDINGCTTGFAVSNNGTPDRGVTTAAHCSQGSNDAYQGIPLYFQRANRGGAHDEQWYLGYNFQVRNIINDGLGGRFITSRTPRWQQVVGGSVCRYGRATGYNCGTIQSTSYLPACQPNATATYVAVTPSTGRGGDSGGPEFLSNWAYGHLVCGPGVPGGADIYVAVDTMESGLSVTVLTAP